MTIRRALAGIVRTALVAWLVLTLGPMVAIGIGHLRGGQLTVVTTGSMSPAVPRDALTLLVPPDVAALREGDVIAYRRPEDRTQVVLHRVVEVVERDGGRFFRTQGDANDTVDPRIVPDDDVTGRLTGSAPHVGKILRWATEPWGPGVLIGVPLLLTGVERLLSGRDRPTPPRAQVWTSHHPPPRHLAAWSARVEHHEA